MSGPGKARLMRRMMNRAAMNTMPEGEGEQVGFIEAADKLRHLPEELGRSQA